MKGIYALIMRLAKPHRIPVGNRPPIYFSPGYYAYVGSTLGGIEGRVNWHFRNNKKKRWHIDYLLPEAAITEVVLGETGKRAECEIARALNGQFASIRNFGASDCRCSSHLFIAPDSEILSSAVRRTFESAGLKPELWRMGIEEK